MYDCVIENTAILGVVFKIGPKIPFLVQVTYLILYRMKDEELMTYMVENSLDLVGRGYGEFSTRNTAYIDLLLTTHFENI